MNSTQPTTQQSSNASPSAHLQHLALALTLLFPPLLLTLAYPYALIVVLIIALAVTAIPAARWMTVIFFAAALGFRVLFNEVPLNLGGFRFYAGDASLYLVVCALVFAAFHLIARGRTALHRATPHERRILIALIAAVMWGVFAMLYGMAFSGLPYRDALGDFRRIFAPMLALLVPLLLPLRPRHIAALPAAIAAGGIIAMALGAYRLTTGAFYHQELEHSVYIRLLADDEVLTLAILLAYVTAAVSVRPTFRRMILALALGAAAVIFLAISGWRMGLLMIVFAPALVQLTLARLRGEGLLGLLTRPLILLLILAPVLAAAILIAAFALPDVANRILIGLSERHADVAIPILGDMRGWAARAAIETFLANPLLGTGLGHQLSYFMETTAGDFLGVTGTTHNLFLDILYQTGILGVSLFILLHGLFIVTFLKYAPTIRRNHRPLAATLFAAYLATHFHYCFEPVRITGMVVLYLIMGFLILLMGNKKELSAQLARHELPDDVTN